MLYGLFFFQAEDGIRDLVRSRGLGDVYKRQPLDQLKIYADSMSQGDFSKKINLKTKDEFNDLASVSYTHLTLPTSDLV